MSASRLSDKQLKRLDEMFNEFVSRKLVDEAFRITCRNQLCLMLKGSPQADFTKKIKIHYVKRFLTINNNAT